MRYSLTTKEKNSIIDELQKRYKSLRVHRGNVVDSYEVIGGEKTVNVIQKIVKKIAPDFGMTPIKVEQDGRTWSFLDILYNKSGDVNESCNILTIRVARYYIIAI